MADKRLTDDLRALTREGSRGSAPLDAAPAAEVIPSVVATGAGEAEVAGDGTAGIASPLTEIDPDDREYHEEVDMTSADGLFVIKQQSLKSITMRDANGALVRQIFGDPNA